MREYLFTRAGYVIYLLKSLRKNVFSYLRMVEASKELVITYILLKTNLFFDNKCITS